LAHFILKKTFESYYYFFSTLLKLEPKLSNIVTVGTDSDEAAIIKALRVCFGDIFVDHRCFIHMKDNIQCKLVEFFCLKGLKLRYSKIFLVFENLHGLLDSDSIYNFDKHLSILKCKWDRLELFVNPGKIPQVHEWILRNEVAIMKESMIASGDETAGLSSPPVPITNNRNESINNVAKAHVDYRKSTWLEMINNMSQSR